MSARPKEHLPARPVAWARLMLLVPFVAVLWVPFYNRIEPTLFGFPFFYWFQLAWIFLGMAVTALVYYATEPR